MVLQTFAARPVANAECVVTLGQAAQPLTTDGNGRLDIPLPPGVLKGATHPQGKRHDASWRHHSVCGRGAPTGGARSWARQARLNNLGYRAGTTPIRPSPSFRSAVEEFQCDEKLSVDGKCGPATQAKLRSVHGG